MRQPGYYWVSLKGVNGWFISYFNGELFENGEDLYIYRDSDFSEINETRILSPSEQTPTKDILETFSGLIRYGYQEAITEIREFVIDSSEIANDSICEKLDCMENTKKEINFTKLKEELDATDNQSKIV